jgi:hypothetical protein
MSEVLQAFSHGLGHLPASGPLQDRAGACAGRQAA